MNNLKKIIVKVQIPIISNDPVAKTMALVYDKSREPHYLPLKEVKTKMNDSLKKFFYAKKIDNSFVLGDEAPWQNW
jgi:hypothetical protein